MLEPAEELHTLRTDQAHRHRCALLLPVANRSQRGLEQVDVEAACQAAIGRDDDETDRLRLALEHERMLVFRIRQTQMSDDAADSLGVRPRSAHALLSLAHLARGHHFHGLGDLLRALEARNLDADFFYAGHVSVR